MTHGILEVTGSHLRIHGEEYASAVRRLREPGDGAESWGDTGLLSPVVSAYTQCKNTALDTFTHMGTVIGGTGDAVSISTGRVSYLEGDMAGEIDRLGGEPDTSWT
ncbi:hypothetical protein [Sphaerisporangium perillae]|uniref:hypothetical protein n=1 Tax=Sphaerisporangium perillae TaxID=2935860 RepID=UPI00200E2306|nr:hypothetical protein [Sphaerisporangium perillae]